MHTNQCHPAKLHPTHQHFHNKDGSTNQLLAQFIFIGGLAGAVGVLAYIIMLFA